MSEQETYLEFPCEFPIKVMGAAVPELRARVVEIAERHTGSLREGAVRERASRNARYLSITVTVVATSKQQLDDLYRELTACELVSFVL